MKTNWRTPPDPCQPCRNQSQHGSLGDVDMTPIFTLFLIPYFADWDRMRAAGRAAFLALVLIGAAIHLRGGWSSAVYRWNIDPANVDMHPERNWDWSDPQFLRTQSREHSFH